MQRYYETARGRPVSPGRSNQEGPPKKVQRTLKDMRGVMVMQTSSLHVQKEEVLRLKGAAFLPLGCPGGALPIQQPCRCSRAPAPEAPCCWGRPDRGRPRRRRAGAPQPRPRRINCCPAPAVVRADYGGRSTRHLYRHAASRRASCSRSACSCWPALGPGAGRAAAKLRNHEVPEVARIATNLVVRPGRPALCSKQQPRA